MNPPQGGSGKFSFLDPIVKSAPIRVSGDHQPAKQNYFASPQTQGISQPTGVQGFETK
jgi:hypothetical protein